MVLDGRLLPTEFLLKKEQPGTPANIVGILFADSWGVDDGGRAAEGVCY